MTTLTYAGTQWMEQAVCTGVPGFTELEWYEQVKACTDCPVRSECLAFGMAQDGLIGMVYGGLSARQLNHLRVGRDRTLRLVCAECGGGFDAKNATARFCGAACRDRAYRRRGGAS